MAEFAAVLLAPDPSDSAKIKLKYRDQTNRCMLKKKNFFFFSVTHADNQHIGIS